MVVAPASDDDEHLPPMVDDGTGSNVHIPSVLIGTTDGAVLKTTLEVRRPGRVIQSCPQQQLFQQLPPRAVSIRFLLYSFHDRTFLISRL